MNSIVSEENKKRMFIAAYVIYVFAVMLFDSKYGEMSQLRLFFPLIRMTAYFLICSKLLLDFFAKGFSGREIAVVGAVGALLAVSAYITKDKNMLIYWAFIAAAHDVEFDRIIKWSLWVHLFGLFVVIASSYLHILDNRIYVQSSGTRLRESLGFQYTTESSNYFFYMILMWVYWRKEKITWKEIAVMVCFSVFLYLKTDTKNSFFLGLAAIMGTILLKHVVRLREYKKKYSIFAVGIVPALASIIIGLSINYDSSKAWMAKINDIISGRLYLAKMGYETYGISLMGQRIVWVGGEPAAGIQYNYVDSSYMQILLNFGIILFVLLLLAFVILGIFIAIKKDMYFLLILVIFAVHSTFDPQLIWIGYNSFIVAYSYIMISERKEKLESTTAKHIAADG